MTLVQQYLRSKGLSFLQSEFSINVKRHAVYPNLVLLKYSQINTVMTPLTRECRGIILDEDNDWSVINYTYKRFANIGETWGDQIDWNTAKVFEKLDGSLMQLYWYDNKWNVATSGTPDASGKAGDNNIAFVELFWNTWHKLGYKLPDDIGLCYAFELCTPLNQLVVRQQSSRIVLHGARRLSDFVELNHEQVAKANNWDFAKSYLYTSLEHILSEVNYLNPLEAEGFVVVDSQFNRLKIKSARHVFFSKIRDNYCTSSKNMLELIRTNEAGDAINYIKSCKELNDVYEDMLSKYNRLINFIELAFSKLNTANLSDKEFAERALSYSFSCILFLLRRGRFCSVKDALCNVQIKNLDEWIKKC